MRYSLDISKQDWFIVFVFGVSFGGVLGSFISVLTGIEGFYKGFFIGVVFGSFIFLYSFALISFSNNYVLKHFPERFWEFISLAFAFLSGFLGSANAYYLLMLFDVIPKSFDKKALLIGFSSIGLLTSLIGYLLYWIVHTRKIRLELEKALILAKLKTLEYQVNPHFLFNTLNILAELTCTDPALAEKAILTFARYIREIMEEESLISVQKELSIVEKFVFIQKLRFPDIDVEYHIEPSVMNVYVPKLSLQILVENAIKHGLRDRGKVWIKGYEYDGKAIFEVIDNGVGFIQIKEGTGLKNLRDRLKLLLGGSLEYYSREGRTVFRIALPLKA